MLDTSYYTSTTKIQMLYWYILCQQNHKDGTIYYLLLFLHGYIFDKCVFFQLYHIFIFWGIPETS